MRRDGMIARVKGEEPKVSTDSSSTSFINMIVICWGESITIA
jgi:hypothetical protein